MMVVKSLLPTMALILAVLGAIYTGIAAPTEAAAVGAVVSVLLTAAYGKFSWKVLKDVSLSTIKLTGMVLLIAACSTAFVSVFLAGGGGEVIEAFILGFPGGKWAVFWMIMLITFVLGAFIDWVGIIFVLIPILAPIIPKLGFDPLWFAMMIIVNLQMSFLTPPFAYAMFFLKGTADPALGIETKDIIRGMMPFVGIIAIGLVLDDHLPADRPLAAEQDVGGGSDGEDRNKKCSHGLRAILSGDGGERSGLSHRGQCHSIPADGSLVPGGVGEQTRQTLENLKNVLEAAGSSMGRILQITVYLTDMEKFGEMNEVYGAFFNGEYPARVTLGVSSLAKHAMVEMQAVALVE